jgi:murein DD-endopeptidase MepM/ murein hydrolase activator NlpD
MRKYFQNPNSGIRKTGCKIFPAISVLLLCTCLKSFSQQLSIKALPKNDVYVFEESRKDSLFNLLVHSISVVNKNEKPVQLEKIDISFFSKGEIFQTSLFSVSDILKSNFQLYQLQEKKMLALYDFMFHTKDLLDTAKLVNAGNLQKETGLILRQQFFTVNKFPDSIRIQATGINKKGKKENSSLTLLTKTYVSLHPLILPVKGNWYAAAGPSAHTHHRWGFMEEFAYDFIQFGNDNLTYKDDYTKPANYYCYGKEVLAVSAGEVVSILEGVDDAEIYPKDLPQNQYMNFIRKRQNDLITKFGITGLNGNSVILKLADNEYAFYAHMQKGSVTVKQGDKVVQGQVIGRIGNSGNTTEPHLHFQVNETSDVFNSRSLPTRFSNLIWSESLEPEGSYVKSGDFIRTK